MVYSDTDGNGSISSSEITQSERYYPYGMKKSQNNTNLHKSKYKYNGIEYVDDHDLDWDMATYRSLDGAMGRWGQVDPKAEVTMNLSPYSAMNNSPINFTDPLGDMWHHYGNTWGYTNAPTGTLNGHVPGGDGPGYGSPNFYFNLFSFSTKPDVVFKDVI